MKNRVIIACRTLEREIQAAMKETGNSCLVYFLPLKYHVAPKEMAVELQRIIDSLENVDEILVCVSGCGGSTKDLKAKTADIIIPKTRDCIDILLSDSNGKVERDPKGIFFTDNWLEFFKESPMAFEKLVKEHGKAEAVKKFCQIYKGFEHFYIVDTGVYNVEEVRAHLKPLVDILNGELTVVKGRYEILRKMIAGKIDKDFRIIKKSESVS